MSTEAYSYGCGMTGIGALFLAPGRRLTSSSLTYVATGEQVASVERLREPGAAARVHIRAVQPTGRPVCRDPAPLLRRPLDRGVDGAAAPRSRGGGANRGIGAAGAREHAGIWAITTLSSCSIAANRLTCHRDCVRQGAG